MQGTTTLATGSFDSKPRPKRTIIKVFSSKVPNMPKDLFLPLLRMAAILSEPSNLAFDWDLWPYRVMCGICNLRPLKVCLLHISSVLLSMHCLSSPIHKWHPPPHECFAPWPLSSKPHTEILNNAGHSPRAALPLHFSWHCCQWHAWEWHFQDGHIWTGGVFSSTGIPSRTMDTV